MVKPSPKAKEGFKHLLINGANTTALIPMSSRTALHFAARFEDPDYLNLIIKHGQNININDDRFGNTPLIESIYTSKFENFVTLLNAKAKYNKGLNKRSALDISKGTSSWQFSLELLERGADYIEGTGEKTPGNPKGLSSIIWTLENSSYWPDAAIRAYGTDYREQVIQFLRNEGVKVYPWYPEDDPRYNPRPESDQSVSKLELETTDLYTATIENFSASGDGYYQYTLNFEDEALESLIINSNQFILDDTYSAMADFKIDENSTPVLSAVTMQNSNSSTVINLETDEPIQQSDLTDFNIDDLGLLNEEGLNVSLNFIEASMSVEDIIKKYGTIKKAKSYDIGDI